MQASGPEITMHDDPALGIPSHADHERNRPCEAHYAAAGEQSLFPFSDAASESDACHAQLT